MSAFVSIMNVETNEEMQRKTQTYHLQNLSPIQHVKYWMYALWLFTCSDMKTILLPSTFFALLNGIAFKYDKAIGLTLDVTMEDLIRRLPLVIAWTWINLLAFNVGNQRQSGALKEDILNKPWRPIPSGRVTIPQAQVIGMLTYPAAFLVSFTCGGIFQAVNLFVLGYIHNELGGGNNNFVMRNLLNAFGFTSFISGALDVILKSPVSLRMMPWFLVIAAIVLTTVHSQDMYDQEGDSAAGRKTIPLVFGDRPARWSIAVAVFIWSWLCPMFWTGCWLKYVISMVLGVWVCGRTLKLTTVKDDRTTFVVYNCWLVSIYALPVISYSSRLQI